MHVVTNGKSAEKSSSKCGSVNVKVQSCFPPVSTTIVTLKGTVRPSRGNALSAAVSRLISRLRSSYVPLPRIPSHTMFDVRAAAASLSRLLPHLVGPLSQRGPRRRKSRRGRRGEGVGAFFLSLSLSLSLFPPIQGEEVGGTSTLVTSYSCS